ncbi:MAG: response regulator transcription factor [Lachnospiraceae bacterium]|nr:response regulator transcription factor [Lachnospiraceae bacterium]
MKIYVCDDETKMLEEISSQTANCMEKARITCFTSGKELLEQLRREGCDVLLLDIDMPGMNGMEVAEGLAGLEQKPLLVFVTGHDELVYESFQYHPFGFIRKQFLEAELGRVLEDCREELLREKKHFNFRTTGGELCLSLTELMFFESEGNYVKVFTMQEEYRFRSTLGAIENSLGGDGFIRVHKGFLVNQRAIRLFGTEQVELINGRSIPLGKIYAESAKQQFMRYLRS